MASTKSVPDRPRRDRTPRTGAPAGAADPASASGSGVGSVADAVADAAASVADTVDEAAARVGEQIERVKPRLRGWLHLGVAPLVLAAGIVFVALAPTSLARVAALVFAITSFDLFVTSALFHRGRWGERAHGVLRRLDHANIFLIIAGTYTPFALLLLDGGKRVTLLAVIWGAAILGVLFRTLWLGAPRWLYTPVYIAMGWIAVFYIGDMTTRGGPAVVWLLAAGGVLYTIGGIVYGTRRPDPSPTWFGFHEIFHAFTVLAYAAHCTAVGLIVLRA